MENQNKKTKYTIVNLPQPTATLLVSGLLTEWEDNGTEKFNSGDIVVVRAKKESEQAKRDLVNEHRSLYTNLFNAKHSGSIDNFPCNSYIGYFKIGGRLYSDYYKIVKPRVFNNPLKTQPTIEDVQTSHKVTIKKIILKGRTLRVPIAKESWKYLKDSKWRAVFYWEKDFDSFYSQYYGLGDSYGLYDVQFYNGDKSILFSQKEKGAVSKEIYTDPRDASIPKLLALVFNIGKLNTKSKDEEDTSFDVLKEQQWILDWNCVKFKHGYFVVMPPSDETIKFKPKAFVYPNVLESYNYLREYLNKKLQPIHCSVKNMEINIYDKVRLDEAIERFSIESRQRVIKAKPATTKTSVQPTPMSFKQAKAKANQMTPEEFQKYKSEFIDFLVKRQTRKYKVIPCVERLSYSRGDSWEYAFLFSINLKSGDIMIVHENINPSRSSLIFVVNKEKYDKAIRAIYDFLQSAEINKRSSLRDHDLTIGNNLIKYYSYLDHDYFFTWSNTIESYINYYKGSTLYSFF